MGDIAISLGTSDTCLAVIPGVPAEPLPFGHIFPHPTLEGKFWSMLCYTNGDLMRKKVRDDYAGGDWDKFSALFFLIFFLTSGYFLANFERPVLGCIDAKSACKY